MAYCYQFAVVWDFRTVTHRGNEHIIGQIETNWPQRGANWSNCHYGVMPVSTKKLKLYNTSHRTVHGKQLRQLSTPFGFVTDGTTSLSFDDRKDLRRVEDSNVLGGRFSQHHWRKENRPICDKPIYITCVDDGG